jgi:hypothetical protein
MRRPVKNRNMVKPDEKFDSLKVSKFINHIMENGKKTVAQGIVYDAFDIIKEKEKVENPLEVFDTALITIIYLMSKTKNKKRDSFLGMKLKSDPKKGMVGFMIKKGLVKSVVRAEILLLSVSIFCFSASLYFLNEAYPIQF